MMEKKMQVIIITLTDGRTATFTGPMQFTEDDIVYVEGIQSYLADLPEDCTFGPIFEEEDEEDDWFDVNDEDNGPVQ